MSVYEFDRYINGRLMAEGVKVEKAKTFEEAVVTAARLASRGPNREVPVLVLRSPPRQSNGVGGAILDDATKRKLREALRFSASRSVISSEDEHRILSALANEKEG